LYFLLSSFPTSTTLLLLNASQVTPETLAAAAIERTNYHVYYDGSYRALEYPGGDVLPDVGVCTDLVIRTYRAVGIDLQQEVHEDMSVNFSEYPNL
jgi:uncharacterized protein YijF (DUF1287 family)